MADKTQWTEEQLNAIDSRDGTVLVSAAAGSGKTSVLVERVIRRITDLEDKCPADELLIVTFTKAAAANMKKKLVDSLAKAAAEKPSPYLMRQRVLLNSAKIGTIDSFCGDIVRENFFRLGIRADYRILSEGEERKLKDECVEAALDEGYSSGDADFLSLADMTVAGGKDSHLGEIIIDLYDMLAAYPIPLETARELFKPYLDDAPAGSCVFGRIMLDEVVRRVRCAKRLLEKANALALGDGCTEIFSGVLDDDISTCVLAEEACLKGDWDAVYDHLQGRSFLPFPRTRKGFTPSIKTAIKSFRDRAKDEISKAADCVFLRADDYDKDRRELLPAVRALLSCIERYSERLWQRKLSLNAYGFNDIEHLAFDLLARRTENGFEPSESAEEISGRYREIMVDEYQDTNSLQDSIFTLISRDVGNLFMVGDVKQSIYRFRRAMPEIFLAKRAAFPPFGSGSYPCTVTLTSNFRSESCVTAPVNYIFGSVMSRALGDVDYDENERLNCAKEKNKAESAAKVGEVRREKISADLFVCDKSSPSTEAEYVADYIKRLVDEGIYEPGDFCILTRDKKFDGYVAALKERSLPVVYREDLTPGSAAETRMLLSLLRVVDNPLSDAELAAALLSPLFGFTTEELAKIRIGCADGEFLYHSLLRSAANGNEKCSDFLRRLDDIRRLEIGSGAYEFIQRVFDVTDIKAAVSAMPGGEKRAKRLGLFLEAAAAFDETGRSGLSAFLRFVDRFSASSDDAEALQDTESVKLCNIHKSKGLEFRVCILTDINKPAHMPNRGTVAYTDDLMYNVDGASVISALGLKKRDRLSGKLLDTLQFEACELANKRMDFSESMRLLYVAATRAIDKLVIFGTPTVKTSDFLNEVGSAEKGRDGRIDTDLLMSRGSMFFWAACALSHHENCADLFAGAETRGAGYFERPEPYFDMDAALLTEGLPRIAEKEEEEKTDVVSFVPERKLKELAERAGAGYKYAALNGIFSKLQASAQGDDADLAYFAAAVPSFAAAGEGPGPAEKGTLTHTLMQHLSFKPGDSLEAQTERIVSEGLMTRKELAAVNLRQVSDFVASPFYGRICAAEKLFREYRFAMRLGVNEAYPQLEEDHPEESVVVQGMIDLFFIEDGKAVIVDYKTDRGVDAAELRRRHARQLMIYKRAVEKCAGLEVKEVLLCSLPLRAVVPVWENGQNDDNRPI